jgi:predicted metal-dependent phosphoesterase TrpH
VSKDKIGVERWLKADLHVHCGLDPEDYRLCRYSAEQAISEAARLGYNILAFTCHNSDIWTRDLSDFADSLGITLIPGMEVTVEGGRHVLVYNFRTGCEHLNTFSKIRRLSRADTLVIAPHAYFPGRTCLRKQLLEHIDVFDAIERSGFFADGLDFNRRSLRIAEKHGKPIVGNGDIHMLWQLGKTFTWIYSEPGVTQVLDAVRHGRVRVEATALSYADVTRWWLTAFWRALFGAYPDYRPLRSGDSPS